MEKSNSKQIVLSIIAVLVLVIAVVGVSYAMYTFSATGTKTASISTAAVGISFASETAMALTNQYPMTDAKGHATNTTYYTFNVVPTNPSGVNITYKLWFTNVAGSTTGDLTAAKINFVLVDADGKALEGYGSCSDASKLTEAACSSGTWTIGPKVLSSYMSSATPFETKTVNNATAVTYRVQAWVDESYNLTQGNNTTVDSTQTNTSTSSTYAFKVNVEATA